MKGIHCQASPIITTMRADQAVDGPGEIAEAERRARCGASGPWVVSVSMRKV